MNSLDSTFRYQTLKLIESHAENASQIVVSVDRVNRGVNTLHTSLENIGTTIGSLCTTIDDKFSELAYHARIQSLQLSKIIEILQSPLDTKSRELRDRAQYAYMNGWIEEAESDFLESLEQNRYDFTIHQALGNIAFIHKKDNQRALDCFGRAAKYALPKSPQDAALAYINQAAVAEAMGDLEGALHYSDLALQTSNDLAESHYVVAKYTSATDGSDTKVTDALIEAFKRSIVLTLWADRDQLLGKRRTLIDSALAQFKDNLGKDVQVQLQSFEKWLHLITMTLDKTRGSTSRLADVCLKATALKSECDRLIKLDSILDLHSVNQVLLQTLPKLLEEGASAARFEASVLSSDTDFSRHEAQRKSLQIKEARIWFIGGGVLASVLLSALIGPDMPQESDSLGLASAILLLLGGLAGLIINVIMTSHAKEFSDYSIGVAVLNDLANQLQSGLESLLREKTLRNPI